MSHPWFRAHWFLALLLCTLADVAELSWTAIACCGGDEPAAKGQTDSRSASAARGTTGKRVLRISADPNNLPFTNERLEGFENKIAELIAREMNAELEYHWRAQRRGFFRQALTEGECDLVLGAPARFERVLATSPYYTSTYVFVWRKDRNLNIQSLDDAMLRKLKIGVQMIGDDGSNSPPAHALADRGIINNVVGYTVYGDYGQENPPARIVEAVAKGDIDLAIVWGPLAGYFASKQDAELVVAPVAPRVEPSGLPFVFSISMGVRKGSEALRDELEGILEKNKKEVAAILNEYGVPQVAPLRRRVERDND